jgi:membrane-bound lytic murein transglycosylase F
VAFRRRTKKALKHLTSIFVLLLVLPLLLSGDREPTHLDKILDSGELRVISRNGPTTYYEDSEGLNGFEYHLAGAFADYLGVKLTIIEEEALDQMFPLMNDEKADMAAAGLTVTKARSNIARFTQPYMEITQQLIYREGNQEPKTIEDLYGKSILVIRGSSHAEKMQELYKDYPQLKWTERHDIEMIDLMEMVHNGSIDNAIIDSNAFDINRAVYPLARVAFDISKPQHLAWALPKDTDNSLFQLANQFVLDAAADGTIEELTELFYGHVDEVNVGGALTFAKRIQTRLPRWEKLMKEASEMYDLDWQLLAAISYQESHWNPLARSYTGVRGLMMLTNGTAKDMGVSDRVDPTQSIHGGAKYFRMIFDRIPKDITNPDRTWLALAAYNVGMGHMEDARVLTERHGGDPDKWIDVRENLPLLAKRKYHRTVKHGYARGWEPVKYVQHIRSFYNILAWNEKSDVRQMNTSRSTDFINAEMDDEIDDNTNIATDLLPFSIDPSSISLDSSSLNLNPATSSRL